MIEYKFRKIPNDRKIKTTSNGLIDTYSVFDENGKYLGLERKLTFKGLWKMHVNNDIFSICGVPRDQLSVIVKGP
jgi:hypothetical protein